LTVLYNEIGKTYDSTRKADPEIVRRLRQHIQLPDGESVLDIGCGTGNYTWALQQSGLALTGIDLSTVMLNKAKLKSNDVNWIRGNVEEIPFPSSTFRGATAILCIHHFDQLHKPFQEVYRVLESGRFVIFTSAPEQTGNYWLAEYFPKAIQAAIKQLPSIDEVLNHLKNSGFTIIGTETFLIQPDIQDLFLGSGRFCPEMYLEEKIRNGISTFASLSDPSEIDLGCKHLKRDIESGYFKEVFDNYVSIQGDYLFIIAKKRL
jgi:ubiquinone/menaquinone biosynthesis C-methylase UbiE